MYQSYYRLKADPFRLSPDPAFCYRHPSFSKGRSYMKYALTVAEGFVVVTGKPGMGKTTLINDLLSDSHSSDYLAATVVTTILEADDLLRSIAYEFGLNAQEFDKATIIKKLKDSFILSHQIGQAPLLIVDEAQNLGMTALEELRLLTNLQMGGKPLLQIFLLGQEKLRTNLLDPRLEQLQQRVTAATQLQPLNEEQTKAYIVHRLRVVGWYNFPRIKASVLPILHGTCQGVPRRINQFCSRLLLHGAAEEKGELTADDAHIVARELKGEGLTDRTVPTTPSGGPEQDEEPDMGAELFATEGSAQNAEGPPSVVAEANVPPNLSKQRTAPASPFESPLDNVQSEQAMQDKPDKQGGDASVVPLPTPAVASESQSSSEKKTLNIAVAAKPNQITNSVNAAQSQDRAEMASDRGALPDKHRHRALIIVVSLVLATGFVLLAGRQIELSPWLSREAVQLTERIGIAGEASSITPAVTAIDPPANAARPPELRAIIEDQFLAQAADPAAPTGADPARAPSGPSEPTAPEDLPLASKAVADHQLEESPVGDSEPSTAPTRGDGVMASVAQAQDGTTGKRAKMVEEIQFRFDSWEIQPEARDRLDALATHIKQQDSSVALLLGHTDNIGSIAYNRQLSRRRAAVVAQYLEKQGIPNARLRVIEPGRYPMQAEDKPPPPRSHRSVQIVIQ